MNDYSDSSASWRSSTSMILWGIIVLTVFGCVASFCEFFFGILDSAKGYIDNVFNVALVANDQTHAEGFFKFYEVHARLSIWTRITELLSIGGWIVYVVGLSRFRYVQGSDKGRWLSDSLYSACWLGLIGMTCAFIGSFLGVFGLLFRLAGWVLNLISLFKFRGAFNQFSIEESWSELARKGAATLRSSYTFGIILAFYPIIIFLTALFIGLDSISNFSSIANGFGADVMNNLATFIGGTLVIFILLGLIAVVLWILQVCFLIGGWSKINCGFLMGEEGDEQKDYSVGMTIGSILASLVLLGLVAWTCYSPLQVKADEYHIGPVEQTSGFDDEVKSKVEQNEAPRSTESTAQEEKISTNEVVPTLGIEDDDPGCGEDITTYKGFIDGRYAIEMSLVNGASTGEYYYTKNKRPIQLRGDFVDDGHLVLKEYVGDNMTGYFDGVLSGAIYRGTWTSADGSRSYPFELIEK